MTMVSAAHKGDTLSPPRLDDNRAPSARDAQRTPGFAIEHSGDGERQVEKTEVRIDRLQERRC